jgi:hypothetical protein
MSRPNDAPSPDRNPGGTRPRDPYRGLVFKLAAVGLVGASALAATGLARLLRGPQDDLHGGGGGSPATTAAVRMPEKLEGHFRSWEWSPDTATKPRGPDLVLLMSGQMHGYLLPCGCSEPQVGGMERRYNLIYLLKQRGWPVVALDAGDMAQKEGIRGPVKLPNVQGLLKYTKAMKSYKTMGYSASGIGEYEAHLTFFDTLSNYALNEPRPRVLAANLKDAAINFTGQTEAWVEAADVSVAAGGLPLQVGVAGVIGTGTPGQDTVGNRILKLREPNVGLEAVAPALRQAVADMKRKGMDLRLLIYQGMVHIPKPGDKATEAVACAEYFPDFNVLLALCEDEEPPGQPVWVAHPGTAQKTPVVCLGHKGKYVGVLGVWQTGNAKAPFAFKYQLVELTPEFQAPKALRAGHPILGVMEEYTRELKNGNYLGRYPQTKHILQAMAPAPGIAGVPTYVGSKTCKKCHSSAYAIWENTPHSHAYATLVKAEHPSNRQYDGECIVCHTVGFGYQGGFQDAVKTPHLENVGCESCHGPGSLHVASPKNLEWQKRMNLAWWKDPAKPNPPGGPAEQQRLAAIDQFCTKCHDIDNDVNWTNGVFPKKWAKIAHPSAPDD